VGGDLINDEIGIQEVSHHASSGTCGGHPQDLDPILDLFPQVPEECLSDFNRFSLSGNITFVDDLPSAIDERVLGVVDPTSMPR